MAPKAPKGAAFDAARRYWESLVTDAGAHFDREVRLDAANLPPLVSWGTSPEDVISIQGRVPDPSEIADENKRQSKEKALACTDCHGDRSRMDWQALGYAGDPIKTGGRR